MHNASLFEKEIKKILKGHLISRSWAFLVAQRLKRLPAMRETGVQSLGREDPLEKEMATHSSVLPRKGHGQGSLVSYSIGSQSWI